MTRRGRPRRNRLALYRQIVAELEADPEVSGREIARRLGARDDTVRAFVTAVRPLLLSDAPDSGLVASTPPPKIAKAPSEETP
jgi:hypothetical protein